VALHMVQQAWHLIKDVLARCKGQKIRLGSVQVARRAMNRGATPA
jgi:hypothetical protein